MNEEEIKLLNKIEGLPRELNIEIRGLILAEICLRKENQQLKEQLQQKEEVIKQLLTYLDKNKLTLNNPNILDFYINVKKILNIEKSDK